MKKKFIVYYTSILGPGEKPFTIEQSTVDKAIAQFHSLMQIVNGLGEGDYKIERITEVSNNAERPAKYASTANPAVGQTKIAPIPVREVK